MTAERRLTVRGALDAATRTLAAAGLTEPRREAIRLLADLLESSPADLALSGDQVLEPDRRRWIDRAVARRASGEPAPYVTGLAGFRNLVLRSDRRALIPRPETEGLVDRALALVPDGVAVDVGTGTGCLALALAQEGRYRTVLGIDASRDALRLADQNRRRLGIPIGLVAGDLLDAVRQASVDVVISNPPYLSRAEYLALDPSVLAHEPRAALESGNDGLDATRRLARMARVAVRPGGLLLVEIAAVRAEPSVAVAESAGWGRVAVENDLFGRPRYLIAWSEDE